MLAIAALTASCGGGSGASKAATVARPAKTRATGATTSTISASTTDGSGTIYRRGVGSLLGISDDGVVVKGDNGCRMLSATTFQDSGFTFNGLDCSLLSNPVVTPHDAIVESTQDVTPPVPKSQPGLNLTPSTIGKTWAEVLQANSTKDGSIAWKRTIPAVEGATIQVVTADDNIVLVSAIPKDQGVYGGLTAYRTSDGRRLWQANNVQVLGLNDGALLANIYAPGGYGDSLNGLDAATGKVRWTSPQSLDTGPWAGHYIVEGVGLTRGWLDAMTGRTVDPFTLPNAPNNWQPDPFAYGVAAQTFVVTGEDVSDPSVSARSSLTGTIVVRGQKAPVGQYLGSSAKPTEPLVAVGDAVWVETDGPVGGGIELNLIDSSGKSIARRIIKCCLNGPTDVTFPAAEEHNGQVILVDGTTGDLIVLPPVSH